MRGAIPRIFSTAFSRTQNTDIKSESSAVEDEMNLDKQLCYSKTVWRTDESNGESIESVLDRCLPRRNSSVIISST
jgi:hypothetical protein